MPVKAEGRLVRRAGDGKRHAQPRRERRELQPVGAIRRESALVEIGALVLVAVVQADRKLGFAEPLGERKAGAGTGAAGAVAGPLRAPPAGWSIRPAHVRVA